MPPVTYTIFWVDGSPDGLWTAGRDGWVGVALVCPQTAWVTSRTRSEFSSPGVYLLMDTSPGYGDEVYIGEADVLRERLNNHYANREWSRLIAFTSRDGSLNKAHVKYLESRLIGLAHRAKRVHLQNAHASVPTKLGEVDAATVENFLAEMLPLYRLLGVNAFTEVVEKPKSAGEKLAPTSTPDLFLKSGDASARGQETPEGFAVYEAAAQLDAKPGLRPAAAELRTRLIDTGVLVKEGNVLRLTGAHVFGSPSLAASVLRGFNMNGLESWKADAGVTLKQLRAQVAGQVPED